MALSHKEAIEKKEADLKELREKLEKSKITILTDYRGEGHGMTVKMITELRTGLRATQSEYKVFKNSLARIAVKEANAEELADYFKNPIAMIFGYDDPAATSKALVDFLKTQKDNPLPLIKAGLMDGKVIKEETIKVLATLPSREVLLGNLLRAMNGPLQGFVNVLTGVPRGLVTALSEIKKKKEEAA